MSESRKKPHAICGTCKPHNLGYMEWHADADRRQKRGETQRLCPECDLWRWPDELPKPKKGKP